MFNYFQRHILQSLSHYGKSRSLLTTVKYKIDNNSKAKNRTKKIPGTITPIITL